jgi:hypothetical protein
LLKFIFVWFSDSWFNTISWVWRMNQESIYVHGHIVNFSISFSISLWKFARRSNSPMGDISHLYCERLGCVNAFFCQKPDVLSRMVKIIDSALPISPKHSWMSFTVYLSLAILIKLLKILDYSVFIPSFLWNMEYQTVV